MEAAALLMHVLAEGQPFDVRFSRGVALLIADSGMAAKSAARVPGNAYMASPEVAVVKEKEQLLTLIKRARIDLVSNHSGDRVKGVRVTAGGPETSIDVKATDLVQRAFADLPEIYGMLSGVVHGLPWGLGDSAQVHGRHAVWQAHPMEVGGSVLGGHAPARAGCRRPARCPAGPSGPSSRSTSDRDLHVQEPTRTCVRSSRLPVCLVPRDGTDGKPYRRYAELGYVRCEG
ncbi:hypothetical protein [Micromonospora coerulea]